MQKSSRSFNKHEGSVTTRKPTATDPDKFLQDVIERGRVNERNSVIEIRQIN
jgi:hypothetical protein